MRLQDKVIAITGSGSGLGRECALLFAEQGARIVTSDLVPGRAQRVAKEVEAAGGHAVGIDADVRSEPDMERLVRTTVDTFGRIDVMFANAGIPEPGFGAGKLEELTLDDWNNVLATNLTGIFLAFKHAGRAMIARGEGGTLLATTSASAFNAYPGFPAYGATKAGANGLIRSVSLEWGKHGIRANALCPTHGMSINFAMPPDAEVLGKSYEEMTPWDPDKRAMPLRLEPPADAARQRLPRPVPGVRRVGVHVRSVHPGHRRRLVRPHVDHHAGRSRRRRCRRHGAPRRARAEGAVGDAARGACRPHHRCRPRPGSQPRRPPRRRGRRHRRPRPVR